MIIYHVNLKGVINCEILQNTGKKIMKKITLITTGSRMNSPRACMLQTKSNIWTAT